MKKFVLITFFVALLMLPHYAFAQVPDVERDARKALAHRMADMTLSILKDQRTAKEDREDNLKRSFAYVVDINWIAKFVAGNAWRTATDEQRAQYMDLYRDYLSGVYVSNYAESPDRKITNIKVLAVHDSEADESRFTTRTEVSLSNDERLKVDYVATAVGEGKYKIIDVIIEGVSLLATHRAEFSKIAVRGGIESVIAKLEERVRESENIVLSMN